MGEEAVCLTLKSDGNMEESHPRLDLKRPRDECHGAESPNKKPAIEDERTNCSNGCVLDTNHVEKPVHECVKNENSLGVELRRSPELDSECSKEKPTEECSNDESSFGVALKPSQVVDLKCLNELETRDGACGVELKRAQECAVSTTEEEKKPSNQSSAYENSSRASLECLKECVVDTVEIDTLHEKAAKKPLDSEKFGRVDLKRSHECVVDTMEELNPNKKPAIRGLNGENSFPNCDKFSSVDSTCLNKCGLDSSDLEAINVKLANESSIDESFSRVEPKPSSDCIIDLGEAKVINKKPVVEPLNDESFSREDSECANDIVDPIIVVINDKKPAMNSSNDVNEFSTESTLHSKCVAEAETLDKTPPKEPTNVQNFSKVGSRQPQDNIVDTIETENSDKKPKLESLDDENSSTVEKKFSYEHVVDATEADTPNKKLLKGSSNDNLCRIELHEFVDITEGKMANLTPEKESFNNGNSARAESKLANVYAVKDIEVETPDKKLEKEPSDDRNASREESKSSDMDAIELVTPDKKPTKKVLSESSLEVLDLNVSPPENTSSSQTVSDQSIEELSRFGCGDIVSSAGKSSIEIEDKQGHSIRNLSIALSKSEVILEGSKSPNSCGVRRIKLKFSKNENGNDDVPSPQGDSLSMEVDKDMSHTPLYTEDNITSSNTKLLKNGKLEKHVKDVKTFLSSGVLEGVEVKYINHEKKLLGGIIKECGYLCGCTLCNFSKAYDASEFEQHAGCKSTCPNDHVFLNNGKSIHRIVEELKYTPVSLLDNMIRDLVGPVFNEEAYSEWKESLELQKNKKNSEKDKNSHLNPINLSQTTMSCSSEVSEDSLGSVSRSMIPKLPVTQKMSTTQGISIERKRVPNKLSSLQNPAFGSAKKKLKKRDNDLHRLLFMPNGLPDGAELAYRTRGERVLYGYKQGNGIVCNCCNTEISPSQFESHAGHAAKRQPYRHIYTSDGVSLHDVSLSLAKGQSLAISNDVEVCSVCGDGGNLIVCDACSQIFHAACLELERIPEGEWCCPHCQDKLGISRKLASSESSSCARSITIRLTRVVKAPPTDVGGCIVCRTPDFSVLKFDDRTIMLCDQCEKEYHVGCLREQGICDLKVLPKGKWFCSEDCCRIHTTLQKLIYNGEKVVPLYMSNTINRKLTEKGLVTEIGDKVEWQVLSGKFCAGKHQSLLSRAVTIFHDSFDPIVAKTKEGSLDLIPAMVCGGNVDGQDFHGIYCAVITVKSVIVSAGLLRIFGTQVAELPLVATTKESRGKGYFQVLFASIMKLLIFLNVEKLVLPAAEKAESIWTQKFGFRKMTEDQFQKYTKDVQLVSFKDSIMLEKDVPRKQQQCQPLEK